MIWEMVPHTKHDCHRFEIRRILRERETPNTLSLPDEEVHTLPADPKLREQTEELKIRKNFLADLKEEAKMHEQLMNSRIGFFLTFVSIAVAGAATAASRGYYFLAVSILLFTFISTGIIAASIKRVCLKACYLFAMLTECRDTMTLTMNEGFSARNSRVPWDQGSLTIDQLGIAMPRLVRIFILLLATAVIMTWLNHNDSFYRQGEHISRSDALNAETAKPESPDSRNKASLNLCETVAEEPCDPLRTTVTTSFRTGPDGQVSAIVDDVIASPMLKSVRV